MLGITFILKVYIVFTFRPALCFKEEWILEGQMVKTWHDVLAVAVLCGDEADSFIDFCLENGANPSVHLTNKQVNTLSLVHNEQKFHVKLTKAVIKPMSQYFAITRTDQENGGKVRSISISIFNFQFFNFNFNYPASHRGRH
ncbi:MAG: hypothetical protein ACI86P_002671 [Flavobacteriales bacterium]|jgi:hypothetical protein